MTTIANGFTVPEVWSKLILRNFDDYGVMSGLVNTKYEGEIKYAGDTVHIPQLGDVTINTHDDDTPITYQSVEGEELVLKIDQADNWGFKITDIEKKQSNIKDLQEKYSERARIALVNKKDVFLHTLGFSGVHAANQLGTKAATKDTIYDICLDLFQALSDSNAINADGKGADGKRPWLIVTPAIMKLIKASAEMTHATAEGDKTVRKGTIVPGYAGFDVKQTTLIKNADGYKILAGTTEAITYANQIMNTKVETDKDYFATFVAGLNVYGAKVLQPKALASATLTVG